MGNESEKSQSKELREIIILSRLALISAIASTVIAVWMVAISIACHIWNLDPDYLASGKFCIDLVSRCKRESRDGVMFARPERTGDDIDKTGTGLVSLNGGRLKTSCNDMACFDDGNGGMADVDDANAPKATVGLKGEAGNVAGFKATDGLFGSSGSAKGAPGAESGNDARDRLNVKTN